MAAYIYLPGRKGRKSVRTEEFRSWKDGVFDTTRFVWDGDKVFAEVDHSMGVARTYTYYPGSYFPHMLTNGGLPFYYIADHAGNVAGLVDTAGVVKMTIRTSPFGQTQITGEQNVYNLNRFAGQYLDQESGLYYMRNRYYDRRTRRFLSEDPIGLEGGINPYVYAGNDPINSGDPVGLQSESCRRVKGSYWQGWSDALTLVQYDVWDCPDPDPSGFARGPRSSRGGTLLQMMGMIGPLVGGSPSTRTGTSQSTALPPTLAQCAASYYDISELFDADSDDMGRLAFEFMTAFPLPKKLLKLPRHPGSSIVTNPLSWVGFRFYTHRRMPLKVAGTARFFGAAGRVLAPVGGSLFAYDVATIGLCASNYGL